ncbi:hypothetical protein BJ508DRAFT_335679 [Ascobolus immersus RN42]|uniref:DUF6589 domain-containing protein n=1 Tax=Ascobolus immersus RN42 TaxID=1160509 RepID=A0A3N4HQ71_ASCIM|nr:hypothetical protein BJ508DRAFT_335679 [Ascobolus immersus RN42]
MQSLHTSPRCIRALEACTILEGERCDEWERLSTATRLISRLGFDSPLDLYQAQLDIIEHQDNYIKPHSHFAKKIRSEFREGKVARLIAVCKRHEYMKHSRSLAALQEHDPAEADGATEAAVVKALKKEVAVLLPTLRKPITTCTVNDIESFKISDVTVLIKANAPMLWRILHAVFVAPAATGTKRNRDQIVTVSISGLCFALNQTANLLQTNFTFFNYSSHTGKRQLTAMNQMGLCLSPSSAHNLAAKLGRDVGIELQRFCKLSRPVLCMDNMDYQSRVKVALPGRTNHINNDTVGYVFFPDVVTGAPDEVQRPISSSEIPHERSAEVTLYDLFPEDMGYYKRIAIATILEIVQLHHDRTHAHLRRIKSDIPEVAPISPLELRRTKIFNLPALPLNQSKSDECMKILEEYCREIGIPPEGMADKVMLLVGDLKTKIMVEGGIFQRQDTRDPSQKFDFVNCDMGLFHLHFAIRKLMNSTYWGNENARDPTSILRFKDMFGNVNIKKDGKDHRGNCIFQGVLTEGFVLSMVYKAVGARTKTQFDHFLRTGKRYDQTKDLCLIDAITECANYLYDFRAMRDDRCDVSGKPRPTAERDVVEENAYLFIRDQLVIREYDNAIRAGDPGRLVRVIEYWCVIVQSSGHKNYALALVELVANLHVVWGDDFKEHFLRSMLVNPSGREGKWLPDDLYCEWVVREVKALIRPFLNSIHPFTRETLARQISVMQASRLQWITMTGAVNYGQSSSLAKNKTQVEKIAATLLDEGVFTHTPGRAPAVAGDPEYTSFKDLWSSGVDVIKTGVPVTKYKKRARSNWANVDASIFDDEGDGIQDDFEDPFAGMDLDGDGDRGGGGNVTGEGARGETGRLNDGVDDVDINNQYALFDAEMTLV